MKFLAIKQLISRSLQDTFGHSVTRSLDHSVTWSLGHSVTWSLVHSVTVSFDHWSIYSLLCLLVTREWPAEIWVTEVTRRAQMTKWPNNQVTKWLSDRVTKWLSDQVTEWQSERVTEQASDRVTEWPEVTFKQACCTGCRCRPLPMQLHQ